MLAGCAVGPDYDGPPASVTGDRFARLGEAETTPPQAGRWWTQLGDPQLDALVDQAMAASPNLEAAAARLRRARGVVDRDRADRLPSVSASGTYIRGALPGISLSADAAPEDLNLELYNLGVMASWEPDLFGRIARTIEQDRAKAEAAQAELEDAQVMLAADVAGAYVGLRDQQVRLGLAEQILEIQRQRLALIQQRRQAGATTDQEVVGSQSDVESAEIALVQLRSDVEVSLNQLSVLTGQAPGALDTVLAAPTQPPLPPEVVAVGDPAALLRRRPDVRQAERGLAAATAAIGVATSQYFPSVSFMGLLGMGGPELADAFDTSNLTRLALPMIQWNILDFGRIKAQVAQGRAGRDEALAQYRGAVLKALEDAESSLGRFGHLRRAYLLAGRAERNAARAAVLSGERYQGGTINRIEDLDVQRRALVARQELVQSRSGVTKAFIGVEKGLGLGWQE